MKVTCDPRVDAMYIYLNEGRWCSRTHRLNWRRMVDYAEDGTPIGVELLGLKRGIDLRRLPQPGRLREILESRKAKILEGQAGERG